MATLTDKNISVLREDIVNSWKWISKTKQDLEVINNTLKQIEARIEYLEQNTNKRLKTIKEITYL